MHVPGYNTQNWLDHKQAEIPEEFYNMCIKAENTFGKKNQDGIIAKMASTYFAKNPVKGFSFTKRNWDKKTQKKIWEIILHSKFNPNNNPALVKVLLDTGDLKLIEFHRLSNKNSFWSAKVIEGDIIGQNFMGKMLERIRKYLKEKAN